MVSILTYYYLRIEKTSDLHKSRQMSVGISKMRGAPGATGDTMGDYEVAAGSAMTMLVDPPRENAPRRLQLELSQDDRASKYDEDGHCRARRAAGWEDERSCGSATQAADQARAGGAARRTSSGECNSSATSPPGILARTLTLTIDGCQREPQCRSFSITLRSSCNKEREFRNLNHSMIYSMDSSHRLPLALDSRAGVGAPQSSEDGKQQTTIGGPGYGTSTCSPTYDSVGIDTATSS